MDHEVWTMRFRAKEGGGGNVILSNYLPIHHHENLLNSCLLVIH